MESHSKYVICCFSILLGFSPSRAAAGQRDSIAVTYRRIAVQSYEEVDWADTAIVITTLYQFPAVSGLPDREAQGKLNRFLAPWVMDTAGLEESQEGVVSVRELTPGEQDPQVEPMLYYDHKQVTFVNKDAVSYLTTSMSPGGVHPMHDESATTICVKTLEPILLDSVFRDGYTQVFVNAVRETGLDSMLLERWLDVAPHQYHGQGVLFSDTAVVLGRDMEWEFGYSHADRGFSEIIVPYRMLKELILPQGPLGWIIK